MLRPITRPDHSRKGGYRILKDVIIIFYPDSTTNFLEHYWAITQEINEASDPTLHESVRNFLCLVKDVNGCYNGILPKSGLVSNERQEMVIAWFQEDDQERAIKKIHLAYDLGPDTNPQL